VFSTLSSQTFQKEAGVELVKKLGGPSSGGPSTTVRFVYRVLDDGASSTPVEKVVPNGAGLMSLYGICRDTFRQLGGGEAFLKAERNWGPDAWEKYEAELAKTAKKGQHK